MNLSKNDTFSKYDNDFSILWGFHGTTDKNFIEIKNSRQFKINRRNNHWLGNGVYFFLNDQRKAEWWSEMTVRNMRKRSTHDSHIKKAVISCQIKVKNKKFLDLDTKDGKIKLKNFTIELEKIKPQISQKNIDEHELLCVTIDLMVRYYDYDVVKYTFVDKKDNINLKKFGIDGHGQQATVFNQSVINFDSLEGEIYDA